ncbi:PqqD family protein [Tardiphaga alba]|uniref:PqqD family protein n=1 Tax=Tardiphaga alba TaxID=340268 RepID=A0ABX8A4E2_9BRAD|nr:PqqD family peptide modification chaperone [Tardiphaga alba]QUS37856.1 PqqD family protein [Tardiphaga alba]
MRIELTPGTSLTTIEGKSVLFSVRTGESYGLNDTAAEMLKRGLEGGVDHAVAWFAENYDAPAAEIRSDIDELTRDLVRVKLARIVAG